MFNGVPMWRAEELPEGEWDGVLITALEDLNTVEAQLLEKPAGEQPSVAQLTYGLSEGLEVELLKETVKAKSPLLVFRFASAEERLPVIVVNRWTELFLQRNQGLSSNVTADFYQGVLVQYTRARKNLEDKEKELSEVEAGYHRLKFLKTEDVDCVLIATDHSQYDYGFIGEHAGLIVDTRNAMAGFPQCAEKKENAAWACNWKYPTL